MLVETGYFNDSGSPCIQFHLAGAFSGRDRSGTKFEAVIDTGFVGLLSMPMPQAIPLGLPLNGTLKVIFGDGRKSERPTALGRITVSGRSRWGSVVLEPNSTELLLGMEFLEVFNLGLVVTKKDVLLVDHDWIEEMGSGFSVKESSPPAYLLHEYPAVA